MQPSPTLVRLVVFLVVTGVGCGGTEVLPDDSKVVGPDGTGSTSSPVDAGPPVSCSNGSTYGADCGVGFCDGTACVPGCLVNGVIYADGTIDEETCMACDASISRTSLSVRAPAGTSCGGGCGYCGANGCDYLPAADEC